MPSCIFRSIITPDIAQYRFALISICSRSGRFKTVGPDESIREELVGAIEAGEISLIDPTDASDAANAIDKEQGSHLESARVISPALTSSNGSSSSSGSSSNSSSSNSSRSSSYTGSTSRSTGRTGATVVDPDRRDVQFFDPERHRVDPRLRVTGEARDRRYSWQETAHAMEVQLRLPPSTNNCPITKDNISVELR